MKNSDPPFNPSSFKARPRIGLDEKEKREGKSEKQAQKVSIGNIWLAILLAFAKIQWLHFPLIFFIKQGITTIQHYVKQKWSPDSARSIIYPMTLNLFQHLAVTIFS